MDEKERKDDYQKLLNLHEQLEDVKRLKKAAASDYRDQIKNIEGEIQDLVKKLKGD